MRELIKGIIAISFVLSSFFVGKSMGEQNQSEMTKKLQSELKTAERSIAKSKIEINALKKVVIHYEKAAKKITPPITENKNLAKKLN